MEAHWPAVSQTSFQGHSYVRTFELKVVEAQIERRAGD